MRDVHGAPWPQAFLAACGGFLAAVLWFDLMFDVQVLGHAVADPLPEAVIASIASYYRRVTTDAHPMQRLIGLVMAATVLGSTLSLRAASDRSLRWLAFLSSAIPISLAAVRVFPNAVRLGARAGTPAEQSALARAIFLDHVFCWVAIVAFTALAIALATRRPLD